MQPPALTIDDVERWNDTFAQEHDIDDYYRRSGFLIRFVEQRRLACIRKMVAACPGDRILEVGCGGGHVLQLFPDSELTGVDVSGEMLRKARRNLEGYRVVLLKGELDELDLPAGSFDRVVCSEVLEHVVDPAEMLRQIDRVLRPRGRAVMTFPNDRLVNGIKHLVRRSGLRFVPPFRRVSWGGDRYHLHVWSTAQMRALLSRHWEIRQERFAPSRLLPIRCCFQCDKTR
ncbi:MAG: class I SAM-dependent methyltransferase [Phycisphaerae bacterium]